MVSIVSVRPFLTFLVLGFTLVLLYPGFRMLLFGFLPPLNLPNLGLVLLLLGLSNLRFPLRLALGFSNLGLPLLLFPMSLHLRAVFILGLPLPS